MPDINIKADVKKTSTLGKVKVLVEQVVGQPSQEAINTAVADYIEAHPGSLSPLSPDVKSALLQIAEKVAYVDEHGEDYYEALDAALNAKALLQITAVYTQSGTVYDTDSLDSLKADLVVTAYYDDGTTADVTSAAVLSGTLEVGTSTITATYQEMTATFDVTVSAETFIYKLESPVTFTGSNYINTGIKFMETDISFTMMTKFVNGALTDSRATLIHCKSELGPNYQGFSIRRNGSTLYCFDGQTSTSFNLSNYPITEDAEIAMVIRHTAGETTYIIDGSVNGIRMPQVVATRGKSTYLTDRPLVLGAMVNNSNVYSRNWIGELNDFRLKDNAVSDDAVTAYIGS